MQSDNDFPLLEAAIIFAHLECPAVAIHAILHEADQLIERVLSRVPLDVGILTKVARTEPIFFRDLGVGWNANDYFDPDNSFVHMVLQMRLGISISLAVLWMELVHGLRLSVWGVSFFGHFLVKVDLPLGQVVIDPVHEKSLSREVLVERLEPFLRRNKLSYRMETPLGLYLRAAPSRGIIARASNNLKEIYRVRRDWNRMFATHERLIVLLQFAWSKYRDRGLTHAELVNTEQALADLEFYPVHAGTSVYRLGCNC